MSRSGALHEKRKTACFPGRERWNGVSVENGPRRKMLRGKGQKSAFLQLFSALPGIFSAFSAFRGKNCRKKAFRKRKNEEFLFPMASFIGRIRRISEKFPEKCEKSV